MESISGHMINQEKEQFIQYLVQQKNAIYKEWCASIIVQELDPYKEKILENGLQVYDLVLDLINGTLLEEKLRQLANEIARERLDAKENIGHFVNNVNKGRSIIVKYIFRANIFPCQVEQLINDINNLFDTFNYYAVTRYTCLKNKMIKEKDYFISENHKDKLVLLGQISSSFIHEFRNPLTAVMGFNKLLKRENPNLKYLDIMEYELQQLNFRIAQFLHTSRAELNMEQREIIYIQQLLDDIQQLTYASLVDVNIHSEIDIPSEFSLFGSREELKQVLLNLFINSIDALRNIDQPRRIKVQSFMTPKEKGISVSNNGPAIDHEAIQYIFEPFFTTKELGTGIGLYVCKKIIESYNGYMTCTSNNELTTFSIHFPREYM